MPGKQQQRLLNLKGDYPDPPNTESKQEEAASTRTHAVITQPLDDVPAQPTPTSEGLTAVQLDGSSSTAQTGATITQAVWAINAGADGRTVATATGLVTSVLLAPGKYTAGLLVIDSLQGNAVATKDFTVVASSSESQRGHL
jgi:hypothetical protein